MFRTIFCSIIWSTTLLAAATQPRPFEHPVVFEPNQGQAPSQLKWMGRGTSYQLFLSTDGASIVVRDAGKEPAKPVPAASFMYRLPSDSVPKSHFSTVRMKLDGSRAWDEVAGLSPTGGVSNYLLGDSKQWHTRIPQYSRVRVAGVYAGIDLVFYGSAGDLEYDFAVAPGADPRQIRLAFEGTERMRIDARTGDLLLTTQGGSELRQVRPRAYQQIGSRRKEINGRYQIVDQQHVTITLAAYDSRKPLIIDPVVIFARFFEGNANDVIAGIAVDSSGNSYITGYTTSTDFPANYGIESFTKICSGTRGEAICPPTAFVAGLSPSGSVLFSTYIGGSGLDVPRAIAVDSTGIYVTGFSNSPGFAVGQYAFGNGDAFVVKLTTSGQAYLYETAVGGVDIDDGFAIAVDSAHSAYVTGVTFSVDFPTSKYFSTTLNPWQKAYGGNHDAFVFKLDPFGFFLNGYSTYIGGSGTDIGQGIAVDNLGRAYVTGVTTSTDFPTAGIQHGFPGGGGVTAFVAKLLPNGSGAAYSVYLGGTIDASHGPAADEGGAIVVDFNGNAYVTGDTCSTNFPTTPGAFQTSEPSNCPSNHLLSAYVTKLSPTAQLLASTYLGASTGNTDGSTIGINDLGEVYIGGDTSSTNFPGAPPITPNPTAGFLTRFNPDLSNVAYTKFLGASINGIKVFKPRLLRFLPFVPSTIYTAGTRFRPGQVDDTGAPSNPDGFVVRLLDDPEFSIFR